MKISTPQPPPDQNEWRCGLFRHNYFTVFLVVAGWVVLIETMIYFGIIR